jgi:hypothetical protein
MMRMTTLFLILLSMDGFAIDIAELQALGIANSALLQAEEMEQRALRSEKELTGRWQNPQLMSQIGSIRSGATAGSTLEVSITQAIPLSQKNTLKKEVAELAISSQKTEIEYFKRWVSHQVTLAAWRTYVKNELFLHGSERARRFSLIKKYLETSPRVSAKQKVELSIISAILIQLEKDQDLKKYEVAIALNDLEFWVGKKLEASELKLSIPQRVREVNEELVDTSLSPELKLTRRQLQTTQTELKLAKSERMPDLFIGGGYRVENIEPLNQFRYAIVGLNIPLWDTGSKQVEVTRAREMRDKSRLSQKEKELLLKQKNQIELIKMSTQQLKRFSWKLVGQSEKTVTEAERGFRQGVLDVTTFLQAENQTHEIVDQVYMSWMSYLENLSPYQLMQSENLSWEPNL